MLAIRTPTHQKSTDSWATISTLYEYLVVEPLGHCKCFPGRVKMPDHESIRGLNTHVATLLNND
jgi:hypothetical protein